MTNSDRKSKEEEILDTLIELLREEHVSQIIDEPIDHALQEFQLEIIEPLTHMDFNRTVSRFFREVTAKALYPNRDLSETESLAQAVFFLEKNYRGVQIPGYDGAWMDVSSEGEDIEQVLFQLADSIKQVEREKYMRWVFLSNVDQLDWEGKERLVSTYFRRYRKELPPQFVAMDPFRFIELIPELLLNVASLDSATRQSAGAPAWPPFFDETGC